MAKSKLKKLFTLLTLPTRIVSDLCKVHYKPISAKSFSHFCRTRKIFHLLIDTREPERYQKGKIRNAINIPISDPDFKSKVQDLLPSQITDVWILVIYAENKVETKKVTTQLKEMYVWHPPFKGPTAIFYADGGYFEWLKFQSKKP
jgi:rhodanese-related sulfurtransferase